MARELLFYVSASTEMEAECELLGQMLASLPQTVRWVIKRTPGPHELQTPDLGTLRRSHFYLILLGMDIQAPIGVEFLEAQSAGKTTFAYRNSKATPSPAASVFARDARIQWENYHTPSEFARHFERQLIEKLIGGTPGFGLDLGDIEVLAARLKSLEEPKPQPESEERRGAGQGGVILPKRPTR
jgi:hypothetical protein